MLGEVAVGRVVRGRLVGDERGLHSAGAGALEDLRVDLGCIADEADRNGAALGLSTLQDRVGLIERVGAFVQVAGAQAHVDAGGIAFDRQHRRAGHGGGQRLRAAHAAEAAGQDPLAFPVAAVVLAPGFGKGFVSALHDALAADVDPRARRHLAVHHQALAVEFVEVLPVRPVRHEVGVGDQHARRVGMRLEHAYRLA